MKKERRELSRRFFPDIIAESVGKIPRRGCSVRYDFRRKIIAAGYRAVISPTRRIVKTGGF